jgi:hypothetical protein
MIMSTTEIPPVVGFIESPKLRADGSVYPGRMQLSDVTLTINPNEVMATVTITAGELADYAEASMIFTDQRNQRGVKPEAPPSTPIELNLRDGYPDPKLYVFDEDNADDMVGKILDGTARHLNPLIWNLRPAEFEAYFDRQNRVLNIYSGRVFLPDSHHRHQAIIKATRLKRQATTSEYPDFTEARQFKVEIYFMSRSDEGDYFYDKNQRPTPTAKSKAYDLTTQDALALLAKSVIERSPSLAGNVNRVTDRLSEKNPQVMTLSTLRGFLEAGLGAREFIPPEEIEKLSKEISAFYEMLAAQRPELALLDLSERKKVRASSLVDAAVMMHGYGGLLRQYIADKDEAAAKVQRWTSMLSLLRDANDFQSDGWVGDFFARANPIWSSLGVLQKTKSGGETISNTRQSRTVCAQELAKRVGLGS